MPPPLLVVRHGESTWNAEHRWAGQADPPLTDRGRAQARALGLRLLHSPTRPSRIVTSDLGRAVDTGRLAGAVLGVVPRPADARLRERRVAWSGWTSDEIEAAQPGMLDRWRTGTLVDLPGGSEPWPAFVARVRAALHDHARRPVPTLVVAHAGVYRVIEHLTGVAHLRHGNAEGVAVHVGADGLRAHHLPVAGRDGSG